MMTTGAQFMSAHQQLDYFKGCVYITQNHGILTPNGMVLKPDQFKAVYGGYTFALDAMNEKVTKSAWEAFIDNQAVRFPKVDRTCFKPRGEPLGLIQEDGLTMVNTYVPLDIPRIAGDVSLFTDHIAKLLPVQADRDVVLAYMAACVQHVGYKFQWCPIIQGAEGNGKTALLRVIEKAVGSRYTHYPNAAELANGGLKFNGWIEGHLFIGMKEIWASD